MSRTNANGSSVTDLMGVMPAVKMDGGQVATWSFPEMAAETFKAGEMVCLSGAAATRTGITKPGTDASGFGILGFAADDAAGAISSFRGVHVATPSTIFVGNVGHSVTSANAQTAATDLGLCYGLTTLSGRTYVDKNKTTVSTTMCRVVGLHGQDAVPTFYGKVYFTVLNTKCQLVNHQWITSSPVDMAV
ncbi:MAG TPA: hypothetical protein VIY48_08510 [Candidatus Paceibacterota bacterium]